jgi:hypothetical protein
MNSVDRTIIGIVVIMILCTPTIIHSNDKGVKSTENDNKKQTTDPVNVKEEQSKIKEEKRTVDVSEVNNVVKTSTSGDSSVNRVVRLDGQEDYLRVADSQSLSSFKNAITIETWLNASSFHVENNFINTIIRKNITGGFENFFLRIRNIDGKSVLQMSVGYDINGLSVPYDFSTGTWYHLAGTYDGRAMTVFVNGINIKSEKVSGSQYIDQSDLFIGKGDPEFSDGEYFHGELDEIRIWNVARSQEEIRAAMNTQLTGKEKGLIAYWNFEDGTAKDLSGHGNDGILSKNVQIVESVRLPLQTIQAKQKSKLVAWWKFENNASDSASDNHGTTNGNPTYIAGKIGQAISLDGDDYVDCNNPDSLNFGSGDWTISAWIKTTQSGTEPDDRGTVFANGGDEAGGIRYALAVNEEYLGTIVLTTDTDRDKIQAMGKTVVNDDKWHHVIGMRNAGQLRVYVDGVLDGTSYLPDGYDLSGASQHKACIGVITNHRDNILYKYFIGLIDEVCIFSGAIDANGVSALYSGENPVMVAQTAITAPQALSQQVAGGAHGSIEGDWQLISDQINKQIILRIRRESDNTLTAAMFAEVPDGTSESFPLDEVSFENGRLYFEMKSNQGVFEGKMKEDGLTIEGQFRQQGQMMALALKRIDAAPEEAAEAAEAAQSSQEQFHGETTGTSNIATVLILVLVLVGVVGLIVLFFVKSSIR